MSKLAAILRSTVIITATGLAGYEGFFLLDRIKEYIPNYLMMQEILKGFSAVITEDQKNWARFVWSSEYSSGKLLTII